MRRRGHDDPFEIRQNLLEGLAELRSFRRERRRHVAGTHRRHNAIAFRMVEVRLNPRSDAFELVTQRARLFAHAAVLGAQMQKARV